MAQAIWNTVSGWLGVDQFIPIEFMIVLMAAIVVGAIYLFKYLNADEDNHEAVANEPVPPNVHFGAHKKVPTEKIPSDCNVEGLRLAIRMVEHAIDSKMGFTKELRECVRPFINEITGDNDLPDIVELPGALRILKLFAKKVVEQESKNPDINKIRRRHKARKATAGRTSNVPVVEDLIEPTTKYGIVTEDQQAEVPDGEYLIQLWPMESNTAKKQQAKEQDIVKYVIPPNYKCSDATEDPPVKIKTD